jgi:hypothetical protein
MRGGAVLLLGTLAWGGCATEPVIAVTNMAGTWFARDTFEVHYQGVDSLTHVFKYANDYPVAVATVDDSTFSFRVAGGTQTQFDSTAGGSGHIVTVTDVYLDGTMRVRGDTAFVELLGKLPLRTRDVRLLTSHRVVPEAECLASLGPLVPTSPPPVCLEAHRWAR